MEMKKKIKIHYDLISIGKKKKGENKFRNYDLVGFLFSNFLSQFGFPSDNRNSIKPRIYTYYISESSNCTIWKRNSGRKLNESRTPLTHGGWTPPLFVRRSTWVVCWSISKTIREKKFSMLLWHLKKGEKRYRRWISLIRFDSCCNAEKYEINIGVVTVGEIPTRSVTCREGAGGGGDTPCEWGSRNFGDKPADLQILADNRREWEPGLHPRRSLFQY